MPFFLHFYSLSMKPSEKVQTNHLEAFQQMFRKNNSVFRISEKWFQMGKPDTPAFSSPDAK